MSAEVERSDTTSIQFLSINLNALNIHNERICNGEAFFNDLKRLMERHGISNNDHFDDTLALHKLHTWQLISPLYKHEIHNGLRREEDKFRYFVVKIYPLLKPLDFVLLLQEIGMGNVAQAFLAEFYKPYDMIPHQRVEVPFASRVLKFYGGMKRFIDDKKVLCNEDYFNRDILKLDQHIARRQYRDRQLDLEKRTAIYTLFVHHASDNEARRNIMREMLEHAPVDLDDRSMRIIYHAKMGAIEARGGRSEQARDCIQQATGIAMSCQPCLATISMLHDRQLIKRKQHSQQPSYDTLECVLDTCNEAMQHLQEIETEEENLEWRRQFLQFMYLCLLNIGSDFAMGDLWRVRRIDIDRAKQALKASENVSGGLSVRRQMYHAIVNARLHEHDDKGLAIDYARKAFEHTERGAYLQTETDNIRSYLLRLEADRDMTFVCVPCGRQHAGVCPVPAE